MNKGSSFEIELFGCCAEYMRKVVTGLGFPDALEYARRCQKILFEWNPERPKTLHFKKLFDEVRKLLPDGDKKKLRLVVAIGTDLDFRYKVDAFFEIKGTNRIATLNVKTRKKGRKSAHIILRPSEIINVKVLRHLASRIVKQLALIDGRLADAKPDQKVARLVRTKAIRVQLRDAIARARACYMNPPAPRPKSDRVVVTKPSGKARRALFLPQPKRRPRPARDPVEDQKRIENLRRVLGL